jgi:hypothetical protein
MNLYMVPQSLIGMCLWILFSATNKSHKWKLNAKNVVILYCSCYLRVNGCIHHNVPIFTSKNLEKFNIRFYSLVLYSYPLYIILIIYRIQNMSQF